MHKYIVMEVFDTEIPTYRLWTFDTVSDAQDHCGMMSRANIGYNYRIIVESER